MLLARVRGARAPTDPVLDPPMLIVAAAFFYFPNFFHQIYDRFRRPFFKQRMILIILVRTSPTVQTLIQIQNASCTLFCLSKSHSNGRCNRVLIFPTTRDVTLICITSDGERWEGASVTWRGKFCVRCWRRDVLGKGLFYYARSKLWNAFSIWVWTIGDIQTV